MIHEEIALNDAKPKILVVDDEPDMREGFRRILESHGFEVETAADGVDGLDLVTKRANFDAALVDLKMPRMGGLELLKHIHEYDEDIVLLVVTAYSTIETAVEATKRGAFNYISKPFHAYDLLLQLRNGLERRSLALAARRLKEERESRLLEISLEQSKSKSILQCMSDGVLVINRDRQVVMTNAACCGTLPEIANLTLPSPLSCLASELLKSLFEEAMQCGVGPGITSREITLGDRTFMASASPLMDRSGECLGAVLVMRDITLLKKLDTEKSLFVSMVAHEIKNPLAAIEGYLHVVANAPKDLDRTRQSQMVQRALLLAESLRKKLSEIMDLTAIQTGHYSLQRSPLDIREIAKEAIAMWEDKAREKNIEIVTKFDPGDGIPRLMADRDAVRSVLSNLIDNAVKYTPENGHVSVALRHEGMSIKAIVEDDGIGMTAEEKEKIFEEFFRAKNPYTEKVPGTGFGLTIVKRLVELHHGLITVESEPGKGSRFCVSFPACDLRPSG